MPNKALLLVDLQYDFMPTGALAVPHGDEVIAIANRLQPLFKEVIATQDWHPSQHGCFAANHPGKQVGELIELHGIPQILWPTHCVQNTPGAELVAALEQRSITHIIRKGTDPTLDSYSAFFDNAQRKSTGLSDYLHQRQITQVYLLGLATDYCVKFSALDACQLGFTTYLIEDGCRGINLQTGDIEQAFHTMREAGVITLNSSSLLTASDLCTIETIES